MSTISVIILTSNEELNLPQAVGSVTGWADDVFVVDSFSTDSTVDIAKRLGCHVVEHRFDNYAKQRNFALEQLPIESEWILFLDADEWVTDELKREISELIASHPKQNGFFIKYRFIWMGKWLRRGYYPTWILRLFRKGHARCEERGINEHLIVDGDVGYLTNDFMHEDRKPIQDWVAKHNRYASREAAEQLNRELNGSQEEIDVTFWGTQAQRKRWIRYKVWNRLPVVLRPFGKFTYTYLLHGAFLEGKESFIFHFLHSFWFPLLIDAKYIEMKRRWRATRTPPTEGVGRV